MCQLYVPLFVSFSSIFSHIVRNAWIVLINYQKKIMVTFKNLFFISCFREFYSTSGMKVELKIVLLLIMYINISFVGWNASHFTLKIEKKKSTQKTKTKLKTSQFMAFFFFFKIQPMSALIVWCRLMWKCKYKACSVKPEMSDVHETCSARYNQRFKSKEETLENIEFILVYELLVQPDPALLFCFICLAIWRRWCDIPMNLVISRSSSCMSHGFPYPCSFTWDQVKPLLIMQICRMYGDNTGMCRVRFESLQLCMLNTVNPVLKSHHQ